MAAAATAEVVTVAAAATVVAVTAAAATTAAVAVTTTEAGMTGTASAGAAQPLAAAGAALAAGAGERRAGDIGSRGEGLTARALQPCQAQLAASVSVGDSIQPRSRVLWVWQTRRLAQMQ